MGQVLKQALAPGPSAYELLMQELQAPQQPAQPRFSDEEIRNRVRTNNQQLKLGAVGQMAGIPEIQNMGGQVFKRALSAREEQVTDQGTFDPLTGQTAYSPEYQQTKQEERRGKVLQQALRYEDARTKAQEQARRDAERTEDRRDLMRFGASLRPTPAGQDPELVQLRKDLVQSQIDKNAAAATATAEKAAAAENKVRALATSASTRASELVKETNRALKMVGPLTTGLIGSGARKISGTPAYNLNALVETIRANIGFQELAQMRQESPTGGALGQVAIRELEMLQATLGNLDTAQSPDQVRQNLLKVQAHFQKLANVLNRGVEAPPTAPATDMPPQGGQSTPGTGAPPGAVPPAPRRRLRLDPATGELVPVQ